MCETMSNIPMEDHPSCVLTEDMFDAAMNQQFAYQDDIESEEELSSQEENMEVDPDTQGSSQDSCENIPPQCNITTTAVSRENTPSCDSPAVSVLVIETGLDKSKQHSNTCEETVPLVIETGLDKSDQHSNVCEETDLNIVPEEPINSSDKNGSINEDLDGSKVNQNHSSIDSNKVLEDMDSNDKKLPILKKILSNDSNVVPVESIDLCDSESEEFSAEDEVPGVETIDDELKSVMESNLMAEIGMSLNKQKVSEPIASKTVESSPPKIAVKSMAQVPSNIFNTLPQKKIGVTSSTEIISSSPNMCSNNIINENGGFKSLSDLALQAKDVPTTIHINRIAVPHQTFVNSQGQKMKCVYVRNHNSLPLVINSNQAASNSKPPKYMMASQFKKVLPKQVPPIMALSNMTVKNMNQKKTVLAKMPTKMLAIAPKFQRPPLLRNAPPRPHQFHLDQNLDSLIKSLLFHNLKKPYKPPDDIGQSTPTFLCLDCSDRFFLQTSLNQHLARRSLSICYWCRICKVQLQFFNRCVFLKHLRGHNCSIKNIDTTCITFSPLSTEAVEGGVATSFLRNESGSDLPAKDCILKKSIKSVVQSDDLTKKSCNSNGLSEKQVSSVILPSPLNKKITTVAGQSKSVCFQTKTSALLNKPISSSAINSQSSTKLFPIVLPKPPPIPTVVQNIQIQTKDQTVSNKKATNSLLLVCGPSSGSDIIKNDSRINSSTSNLVSETECRDIDDVVIDEDTEKTNENQEEEEEVDVENVTENNLSLGTDIKINQKKSKEKPASTSLRRYCGECGTSCVNINKHLNGSNRPTNPKLACEVCKLILPTRCALKIHLRIHMKLPPFKCPDCGKDFNSWDDVNAHVKFSCGHLAKCVRYMCVSCKAHFASSNNLGNHIMTTHSRDIYKCTSCPVAFFNKDSLNKHLVTIHPKELVVGNDYKQCSLCPKKLVPIDKFVSHVQDHTKANNVLMYGYKCPLCFIVFANKMAFIIHQIKEKKEFEEKGTTKVKTDMADHEINDVPDVNTLSDSNSDIEEEPVIVPKYPGSEDSLPAEKDPLSLDGWEHTQEHQVNEKREELCIVCKTNAVVLLPGIDLNDQSLCCKQCVKPLDVVDSRAQNKKTLINYNNGMAYNLCNSMRNKLEKSMKRKYITPKAIQRSHSLDDANISKKKRKSDDNEFFESSLASHQYLNMIPVKKKNRKKQYKDKATFGKEQAHIQGQVVDSKAPDELLCAKCKFVADTRETFLEHITIHRTDPHSFQCLECGLCFVVLPSLERHLQINHGIKDVSIYIENNRSSLPEKFVSFEEEADDNQCRVCHEMFDSISSLEKHFRSHGMAFMNSLSKSP